MLERELKDLINEQFARIGAAIASPKRLELLDLLGQGERSVEALAEQASMSVGNTSQHLQSLRQARLVDTRRDGTRVLYRLADDAVGHFLLELRQLARHRLAEVDQVVRDYFGARDQLEPVSRTELQARLRRREVVLIDVRPPEEYAAGHIKGAISIPLKEVMARVVELPHDLEVVAYCRGPYCVFSPEAVTLLRERGFRARRLEEGFPEWRLAGLPVEIGAD
jgi:rhodanese-related sulfurtransferase/DNA-binding MarR family transcriptional regulator